MKTVSGPALIDSVLGGRDNCRGGEKTNDQEANISSSFT